MNPQEAKQRRSILTDIAALNELISLRNIFVYCCTYAPFTLNLCSADEGLRDFAIQAMTEDLATMEYLLETWYNFHRVC